MNLAIAVIAKVVTPESLGETAARVIAGGFHQWAYVFAETLSKVPAGPRVLPILDPYERGKFANWHTTARWMLDNTDADTIIITEDGLEFAADAAERLDDMIRHNNTLVESGLWGPAKFGYASLFTAELLTLRKPNSFPPEVEGWREVRPARDCVGSQCMAFTRRSLRTILESPLDGNLAAAEIVAANPQKAHEIDAIIGDACAVLGLRAFYHNPSLCRMARLPAVQDARQGTESRALGFEDAREAASVAIG